MDISAGWGNSLALPSSRGNGHGWQQDNSRLSRFLDRPSLDMEVAEAFPSDMLAKYGIGKDRPTSGPKGALPHVYLPSALAATYVERRPRWRMVLLLGWLGFQLALVGCTLAATARFQRIGQPALRTLLWAAPSTAVVSAPLAAGVLLYSGGDFRMVALPAAFLGVVATGLPMLAELPAAGQTAGLLICAGQICNAIAFGGWGGSFLLLCASRFERGERVLALGLSAMAVAVGVALCWVVAPYAVHSHSDLVRLQLGELMLAVVGASSVLFGFPGSVAICCRSSAISIHDAKTGLIDVLQCDQTRILLLTALLVTGCLSWNATVESSVLRDAAGSSAWSGPELTCARVVASAATLCLAAIAAAGQAKLSICMISVPRPLTLIGCCCTLYTAAMLWWLLILPTPFTHRPLIAVDAPGALVASSLLCGVAEAAAGLMALELATSLLSSSTVASVGLGGCLFFCWIGALHAVAVAVLPWLEPEATTVSSFCAAAVACLAVWVCQWRYAAEMDAEAEEDMLQPSWINHDSLFDRQDPIIGRLSACRTAVYIA